MGNYSSKKKKKKNMGMAVLSEHFLVKIRAGLIMHQITASLVKPCIFPRIPKSICLSY